MTPDELRKLGVGYNIRSDMTFTRQLRLGCTESADEIERLREALCYYVNECAHIRGGSCNCLIARKALESEK
jgi:hypothetical protein